MNLKMFFLFYLTIEYLSKDEEGKREELLLEYFCL